MRATSRLGYVDWLRGLAVLLMMQTHAYDSWLAPAERIRPWYLWSRVAGGAAAPLFLFLAGLALALGAERRRAITGPGSVVREGVTRGLEVLGYAVLFRLWMFTTGGFTRPADLLRVDVLNCIGLSMALVSLAVLGWPAYRGRVAAALTLAAFWAAVTPLAWDSPWPAWVPDALAGYVNGRLPASFFPLFPWAAFTALGAAAGLVLARARAGESEGRGVSLLAGLGLAAIPAALALDALTPPLMQPYDYWHTSPSYFLLRVGVLLVLLGAAFLWNSGPWARWPSGLRQLGRTSLLVYWVHIEIVYGLLSYGHRQRLTVAEATLGLVLVTLAMLLLSLLRTGALRIAPRPEAIAGAQA